MQYDLSEQEMLELWRLVNRYEPLYGAVTVDYGPRHEALLTAQMRQWYSTLLETAPLSMLCPEEIASSVNLISAPDRLGIILLPQGVKRVVSVKLGGWDRPARIVTDPESFTARCQLNPFTRAGCADPVAIVDGRNLRCYSRPATPAHPAIESLIVVRQPPDGRYRFQASALPIPTPTK